MTAALREATLDDLGHLDIQSRKRAATIVTEKYPLGQYAHGADAGRAWVRRRNVEVTEGPDAPAASTHLSAAR